MSSIELRRMKRRIKNTTRQIESRKEAVYKFLTILYFYCMYNRLLTLEDRRRLSFNILSLIMRGTFSSNFLRGLSIPFNF
jgi:hypothetical protein